MTLHPQVAHDLIEVEAESVRLRLGDRIDTVEVDGTCAYFKPKLWGGKWLRLDGSDYDHRPLRIAVVDGDRKALPGSEWPGQLHYGMHPVLHTPWACIRGTYEYHVYPGHAAEVWDQFRATLRMWHLVSHILNKASS